MVMLAKIKQDGRKLEVSTYQAGKYNSTRIYNGAALRTPEHWDRKQKLQTGHHAGLLRVRQGQTKLLGDIHLSPHEVGL